MTLAQGRHLMTIPGPSIVPDRVLIAMHRAAPNIYEGDLLDTTAQILRDLKTVARSTSEAVIYIANGHGAWEGALHNILAPGDFALVLASGRFAQGWRDMANALGVQTELMDFGTDASVDPNRLEKRLREDKTHKIKAILVVQTDTASSVRNDIASLRKAIDASGHPALFAVDCIASLACERFEMDAWGVDVMVAACQKGLMTPPGLSFNFMNEKALTVRRARANVSPYFDWLARINPQIFYQTFCGTPPTHHLLGLSEALDMILREEGLENVWARHRAFAGIIWRSIEVWQELGDLRFNVADASIRSNAVTTIQTGPQDALRLRNWCEKEMGLTLGIGLGLGDAAPVTGDSIFRIGHMGHLSPPMLLGALSCIDAGLKALKIEHGGGALRVASEELAALTTRKAT